MKWYHLPVIQRFYIEIERRVSARQHVSPRIRSKQSPTLFSLTKETPRLVLWCFQSWRTKYPYRLRETLIAVHCNPNIMKFVHSGFPSCTEQQNSDFSPEYSPPTVARLRDAVLLSNSDNTSTRAEIVHIEKFAFTFTPIHISHYFVVPAIWPII